MFCFVVLVFALIFDNINQLRYHCAYPDSASQRICILTAANNQNFMIAVDVDSFAFSLTSNNDTSPLFSSASLSPNGFVFQH